jgi:hypothetical protein
LLGIDKQVVGLVLDRIRDAVPNTEEMFGMQLASDAELLVCQAHELMQIIQADTADFHRKRQGDLMRAARAALPAPVPAPAAKPTGLLSFRGA